MFPVIKRKKKNLFLISNTLERGGIRMTRSKRDEGEIGGGKRQIRKLYFRSSIKFGYRGLIIHGVAKPHNLMGMRS